MDEILRRFWMAGFSTVVLLIPVVLVVKSAGNHPKEGTSTPSDTTVRTSARQNAAVKKQVSPKNNDDSKQSFLELLAVISPWIFLNDHLFPGLRNIMSPDGLIGLRYLVIFVVSVLVMVHYEIRHRRYAREQGKQTSGIAEPQENNAVSSGMKTAVPSSVKQSTPLENKTSEVNDILEKIALFIIVFAVVGFLIYTGLMQRLMQGLVDVIGWIVKAILVLLVLMAIGSSGSPSSSRSYSRPRYISRKQRRKEYHEALDREIEEELEEEMEEDDWDEEHGY